MRFAGSLLPLLRTGRDFESVMPSQPCAWRGHGGSVKARAARECARFAGVAHMHQIACLLCVIQVPLLPLGDGCFDVAQRHAETLLHLLHLLQHRGSIGLRAGCSSHARPVSKAQPQDWRQGAGRGQGGVVHKYSAARTNSRKPSHNPGPVHAPLSGGFDFYQAGTDAAPRQARSRGPPARLSFRGLHSHGSSTSTGWHPAALCRPRRRHPGMVRREALARADFRAKHGRLRHAPCTAWGARAWTPS